MAVGLLTFIVLARFLGPASFGVIATAIAYAAFASVVSDFGLSTYVLRTAAIAPDDAGRVVRDALAVKTALSILLLLPGVPLATMLLPLGLTNIYALAYLGVIAYSAGDLAMIVVRARQRFAVELKLVLGTSIMLMAGVAGVAALTGDLLAAAVAFAVTRLLYLGIVLIALRRELAAPPSLLSMMTRGRALIGNSRLYAADGILTTLSGQIDLLLFGLLLTSHQIGIYQAGSRLVQAIVPFAVVLSTVYLPALSSAAAIRGEATFRKLSFQMMTEFSVLAIVAGFSFALLGPLITDLIYGPSFTELKPLWIGFAIYSMFRLVASSYGIQLVALGRIRPRIISNIISLVLFIGFAVTVVPATGLAYAAWGMVLAGAASFTILGSALALTLNSKATLMVTLLGTPLIATAMAILLGRI
jgi:O-antigen/teichoic acid export membrane protein